MMENMLPVLSKVPPGRLMSGQLQHGSPSLAVHLLPALSEGGAIGMPADVC